LTTWHCIAELTKSYSFRLFFWRFCPLGESRFIRACCKKNKQFSNMPFLCRSKTKWWRCYQM